MKPYFDIIVVIPVGPNSSCDFIVDSIESFEHFTKSTFKVIVADDSQQGIGAKLTKLLPAIDVITTEKNMGWHCGLYINLSNTYRYALEHFHFHLLFKMDTDALIIGEGPETEALELFGNDMQAGMAGQYQYDYKGNLWDTGWPRRRILNGMETWKFIRRPFANAALKKYYNVAVKNGYQAGESVFGGAYFMSIGLLQALLSEGLLPNLKFKTLNLGEDHLFSLLTKAVGYNLCNLSIQDRPFGCAWKGLPASPVELLVKNKKIIHSVRYWDDLKEPDIRQFFQQTRQPLPTKF